MISACPECNGKLSSEADACPHCGYKPRRGAAPPPDATTPADRLVTCSKCDRPNWRESSACYSCNTTLQGAAPAVPKTPDSTVFQDIASKLPSEVRKRLLSGEPAYAYVSSSSGCGTVKTELLVTDSRVIVQGIDLNKKDGCGEKKTSSLEIPIAHVSSVSNTEVDTGCGTTQGIGIASGSASQGVTAERTELDGALRILQALIRAQTRR